MIPALQRNLCRHIVRHPNDRSTKHRAVRGRTSPPSTTSTTKSASTSTSNKIASVHHDVMVDMTEVTIFVDPVDGTREFVEGRLSSCQCLVGIAVNGMAMAGAIGIPFPTGRLEDSVDGASGTTTTPTTIVYGQVGAGYGVLGGPLPPMEHFLKRHGESIEKEQDSHPLPQQLPQSRFVFSRPILASGDSDLPLMVHTRQQIVDVLGGSNALLGGSGNKILATALGYVDCTIQHQFGGPWDTCAPQAVLQAMGGRLTDWDGNELVVYGRHAPLNANQLGFVATTGQQQSSTLRRHDNNSVMEEERTMSSSGSDSGSGATTSSTPLTHDTLIGMLRMSPIVQSYVVSRQQKVSPTRP